MDDDEPDRPSPEQWATIDPKIEAMCEWLRDVAARLSRRRYTDKHCYMRALVDAKMAMAELLRHTRCASGRYPVKGGTYDSGRVMSKRSLP